MPDSLPARAGAASLDDAAIFPPGDAAAPRRDRGPRRAPRRLVRRPAGVVRAQGHRPAARPGRGATRCRSSSPAAPGRSPGRSASPPASGLHVAGLEIALRDPDDLAGNARRVVAAVDHARGEGVLADDVPSTSSCRRPTRSHGWQAAADEVAAAELRLKLRTGGVEAAPLPARRAARRLDRRRAGPRAAVQVHRGPAPRRAAHVGGGLRAARLPQRPAGDRPRLRRRLPRRDRRDPRGARRRPAGG